MLTEERDMQVSKRPPGDEFEREPVPEEAQKGPSAFWGIRR
jgi:hypothetical protein